MRSLGRSSMNFETTDLTTSMRLTRRLSTRKSSACMEPETSSPSTMSMPLAVTSVRLLARCGRARPTIMKRAGEQRQQPEPIADAGAAAARHFAGKADIGKFDGGDRSAPPAQQHHHGQQREQPQPFRLKEANHAPTGWLAGAVSAGTAAVGFDVSITKRARALVQRFHDRLRQGHAGEFGHIAAMEEFRQQAAMHGQRRVRGVEQIVQELFGGAVRGGDVEGMLRCSRARCPRWRWRIRARSRAA